MCLDICHYCWYYNTSKHGSRENILRGQCPLSRRLGMGRVFSPQLNRWSRGLSWAPQRKRIFAYFKGHRMTLFACMSTRCWVHQTVFHVDHISGARPRFGGAVAPYPIVEPRVNIRLSTFLALSTLCCRYTKTKTTWDMADFLTAVLAVQVPVLPAVWLTPASPPSSWLCYYSTEYSFTAVDS